MTTRQQIADEARKWVNTPYQHQARVMGAGVDCVQLVVGTGLATGALQLDSYFEKNKEWHGYSRTPNPRSLMEFTDRYLLRVPKHLYKLGDVLVFAWRPNMPQHFSIVSALNPTYMVHAHSHVRWCAEHVFDKEWQDRHVATYSWKQFEAEYD